MGKHPHQSNHLTLTQKTPMGMKTKTAPCPHCKTLHAFEVCDMLSAYIPLCDDCGEIQAATWHLNEKRKEWQRRFNTGVPDEYRAATPEEVTRRRHYIAALTWKASDHHGGLGLVGTSGAGKSCAIACRIRTLEEPFVWWSSTQARDKAHQAATAQHDREGARRQWEVGGKIPILVLDDVSQAVFSQAWSSKLFDLLESRLAAGLPTLWTSQLSPEDLRSKIVRQNGGDEVQAEAISRRLCIHSLVIHAQSS
jgi:DNA replication protein DnaC